MRNHLEVLHPMQVFPCFKNVQNGLMKGIKPYKTGTTESPPDVARNSAIPKRNIARE